MSARPRSIASSTQAVPSSSPDSVGNFTPPGDTAGARLQTRTYPGLAPAPAAGAMAYVYRVDMTAAKGIAAKNCVTKLTVDFGPVVKLPYSPKGLFDVFVVTSGGPGQRRRGVRRSDGLGDHVRLRRRRCLSRRDELFLRTGFEIDRAEARRRQPVLQPGRRRHGGRPHAVNLLTFSLRAPILSAPIFLRISWRLVKSRPMTRP
ncbi:MAG: hypothetical protein WDM81_17625 [Rhizomicrobium sp.]